MKLIKNYNIMFFFKFGYKAILQNKIMRDNTFLIF